MEKMKRIPDAEFEVMKVVWANEPPITNSIVMEQLGAARKWKPQVSIALLLRLVERGFLGTEKTGKERTYYPLVKREDYLKFETDNFIKRVHDNSFFNMINTLYGGSKLSGEELSELVNWAKERRQ